MDFDGDMRQDFLLSATGYDPTNDRCYFEYQNADKSFTEIGSKLGLRSILKETHSQRPFDFDLDGDDDFLIEYSPQKANAQSGRVWLMRNDIANTNNHITVKLQTPAGCNRSGIGCRVSVYAGGVRQLRDIHSGIGRWGMAAPTILNFGLAKNTAVDSIVVRWAMKGLPTTTVLNPPINQRVIISDKGLVTSAAFSEDVQTLEISPAPAQRFINLRLPTLAQNHCTAEIYSLHGELLQLHNFYGQQIALLNIEGLVAGAYFVRVSNGDYTRTKSFIKVP
jgi:hypothetical protein